ncbi:uncharacterized protein A1O9_11066 [Exophiala aquamarina CBS 119918]|uniref:Transcription factor domain-containing protein n=1 Tax=Exophiala aquamarina CBS 119918 TaxID=1182545 RepID=A0A072NXN5_9EURO|nr:uncharacterized protein A1O9_11066 [Exophiala aquamarina CBS 119918]KEF52649.1 hypothetical protein A1O9_11066 [Exophiala aquamarina CBS 119918]
MVTNPSFMLISIAKTACMHLGLHRPEILQDFNRVKFRVLPEHVEEAAKVWAGCCIAAESITSTEGQSPLFVSTDPTLSLACDEENIYHLPQHLRHVLVIQRFLNRVNCCMTADTTTRGGRSSAYEAGMLLASLEDDLHQLEKQLGSDTTEVCNIWISSAALQLQSYYFLEPLDSPTRKHGLLRAYHTATKLISQMKHATENEKFSTSAPHYFGQMVKLSALVVMKVLFSSYSRILDIDAGKRTFNTAISMQRSMSVEINDFPSRDCVVLTHLWAINQSSASNRNEEPTLRLNTRHSASVLHDSLWVWRNYYEERAINTEHLGRPPRVLPSLIQHSPVATMDTPNINALFEQYPTAQNRGVEQQLGTIQGMQQLTPTMSSQGMLSNNIVGTNNGLMAQTNSMMNTTSPDPFDLMGNYMIPEAESSGMFYPSWMWDAGFSLQS